MTTEGKGAESASELFGKTKLFEPVAAPSGLSCPKSASTLMWAHQHVHKQEV